jgi:endonuclease I/chitodextrinase
MYSENPTGPDPYNYQFNGNDECGNYNSESDCYNKEHIFPQGFFNQILPMRSDIHHVVPTDGRVNGFRSNFPFGEVGTNLVSQSGITNPTQNGSKLGNCISPGYSGTVFEPIDEFKGDIARMLLYFAVRYEDNWNDSGWDSPTTANNMLNGTSDQFYESWYINLLLDWHNGDAVNQRETDRNNAAYNYQGNRNPFIDNPAYADLIWNPNSDTQDPTTPTNLVASNPTASTVDLAWTASTDNTAITNYDIYVDGAFYVTTSSNATTFTVTGLSSETTYTFTVLASDAAGNVSILSASATETTLAGGSTGSDCANEDFENIPANVGAYDTRTWTGVDGIANGWTATDARTDQVLNTRSICIRNGALTSPSLSNGIGNLTVTTQLAFGGSAGTFDVKVNGTSVGSIPYTGDNTTSTTTTISNINIIGNVTIVLENQSSSNRVRIDDLSWNCYSSLSVDDFSLKGIKIYPNPVKGNLLNIEVKENTRFEIYSILGKKVLEGNVTPTNKQVSVSKLNKGVYIVKLETPNGSISKKLVKG